MMVKILRSAVVEWQQLSVTARERLLDDIGQIASGPHQLRRLWRRLRECSFGNGRFHELRFYSVRLFFYVEEKRHYVVGIFTNDSPPLRNVERSMWQRVERAQMMDASAIKHINPRC